MGEQPTDSAGRPWGGRTLPTGGFAGDDGTADVDLVQALAARAAGVGADAAVVRALAAARLLVPVVAVLGEGAETTHGTSDRLADLAVVTLTGPDRRRALPVFSTVAALAAWDATARPVPVSAQRAAMSAVAEDCDLIVLDPAGPTTFVVSRPAVWALGQARDWLPAYDDPAVLGALHEAVAGERDVASVAGERGQRSELRVVLAVRCGLARPQVQQLAERVGAALQASDVVRERVDGVELAVTTG